MQDLKSLRAQIEKELGLASERISIIKLVDLFVAYACQGAGVGCPHRTHGDGDAIRYRIDGLLYDVFGDIKVRKDLHPEVISRIKVLSGLRTDEHLLPQDGRFKVKLDGGSEVDVRVSIIPTYYGENAIMRVLAQTQSFTLSDLGFSVIDLKKIGDAIKKPYGMILANGPTGSRQDDDALHHPEGAE